MFTDKNKEINGDHALVIEIRGVDPGGAGGAVAPPTKILGGQTYRFAPPIIPPTLKKNKGNVYKASQKG